MNEYEELLLDRVVLPDSIEVELEDVFGLDDLIADLVRACAWVRKYTDMRKGFNVLLRHRRWEGIKYAIPKTSRNHPVISDEETDVDVDVVVASWRARVRGPSQACKSRSLSVTSR